MKHDTVDIIFSSIRDALFTESGCSESSLSASKVVDRYAILENIRLDKALTAAADGNFEPLGSHMTHISQIGEAGHGQVLKVCSFLLEHRLYGQAYDACSTYVTSGGDNHVLIPLIRTFSARHPEFSVMLLLLFFKPIVTIKIGMTYNPQVIGNFSNAADLFLRRQQLEKGLPSVAHIFLAEGTPVNHQLMTMLKRKMNIVDSDLLLRLYNSEYFQKSEYYVPMQTNKGNEFEEFNSTSPNIAFTVEEEAIGEKYLREMGIGRDDWFVCVFARDGAFKKEQYPQHNFITEDIHRNADINSYRLAIDYIIKQGGYVVRIGSVVNAPLDYSHPRVIDYSTKFRNDFMDVYLSAKCRYLIGTTSGICDLCHLFDTPNIRVNSVPPGAAPWGKNSIYIPKKVINRFTREYVTFREMIDKFRRHDDPSTWNGVIQYEMGYVYEDNSEEEILETVVEMHQRLDGTFRVTQQDIDLQERYLKLFPKDHWSYGNRTPVSRSFLERNKHLFFGIDH